jgi:homoserine O-acetyltransferase/O-succinyltransferase
MHLNAICRHAMLGVLLMLGAAHAQTADPPQPQQGDFVVKDFRFHTGEVLPELRLHYMTLGAPTGEPVLVLHGSSGSGQTMMARSFAGELFGPGQPLDAAKYFIVIPDAIGSGKSSRPSDGLRTRFPKYSYEDMVVAQHRLLTEHLGIRHVKLVIGQSMGGMHAWMWGEMYPDFMSVLMPLGSQPTAMSGRNWMLRRMLIEMIRSDPAYNNGNYTEQPPTFRLAANFFSLATSGGTQALQQAAPTRAQGDQIVEKRLAGRFTADANDYIYSYNASRDYDPSPALEKIKARVLAINAADDERNPVELGILEREIKRVKNGAYYQIPASAETRGHGTSGDAKWWKHLLPGLLNEASTPGQ